MTNREPLLLSIREASTLLGIGYSTLFALVRSEQIPSVKIGGRRLLRVEDVRNLAASGWEGAVRSLRAKA